MKEKFELERNFTGSITISDVEGDFKPIGLITPKNDGLEFIRFVNSIKDGDRILISRISTSTPEKEENK